MSERMPPRYRLTDLTPDGCDCFASSINSRGDVVGECGGVASNPQAQLAYAWWSDGSSVCIGAFGSDRAGAWAVNDERVVVGRISQYAFVWSNNDLFLLPPPAGKRRVEACDVNHRGEVVGVCDAMGQEAPFVVRDGRFQLLPFDGWLSSRAEAISNTGIIVGCVAREGKQSACTWVDDQLEVLRGLPSGSSRAHDINASGSVVGFVDLSNEKRCGFIHAQGESKLLQVPEARVVQALGINEVGQVVGFIDYSALRAGQTRRPFLFSRGRL